MGLFNDNPVGDAFDRAMQKEKDAEKERSLAFERAYNTEIGPTKSIPADIAGMVGRGLIIRPAEAIAEVPHFLAKTVPGLEGIEKAGDPLGEWAKNKRNETFFSPSTRERDSLLYRGIVAGGLENAPMSVGPGLAGALLGAKIGAPLGGPWGAAAGAFVGGAAGVLSAFGPEAWSKAYKSGKEQGLSEKDARSYGWDQFHTEATTEALMFVPEMMLGGATKWLGLGGKQFAKESVLNMLKQSKTATLKQFGKDVAKVVPLEAGTEMGQEYAGIYQERAYGLKEEGEPVARIAEAGLGALGMTLLFVGGAHGVNRYQSKQAVEALSNEKTPPEQRQKYADFVTGKLQAVDPDLANAWSFNANQMIAAGQPIALDTNLIEKREKFKDIVAKYDEDLSTGKLSIDHLNLAVKDIQDKDPFMAAELFSLAQRKIPELTQKYDTVVSAVEKGMPIDAAHTVSTGLQMHPWHTVKAIADGMLKSKVEHNYDELTKLPADDQKLMGDLLTMRLGNLEKLPQKGQTLLTTQRIKSALTSLRTAPAPNAKAAWKDLEAEIGKIKPGPAGQVKEPVGVTPPIAETPAAPDETEEIYKKAIAAFDEQRQAPTVTEKAYQEPTNQTGIIEEGKQPERFPIEKMNPQNIKVAPETYQFKLEVDKKGLQAPLPAKDFNPIAAGAMLVYERENGDRFVINGHHRLELAQRTATPVVNVQVVREKDGYSPLDARRIAAEANILEGKGTIHDQAEFFRLTPEYTPEVAAKRGVTGAGYAIGRFATDNTYAQFTSRRISAEHAEVISRAAPNDEAIQAAGVKYSLAHPKADKAEIEHLQKALTLYKPAEQTGDLFDFDDSAIKESEAMSKQVAIRVKDINNNITAIRGAANRPEIAAKHGVNVADPEGVKKRLAELLAEKEKLGRWYLDPAMVAEVRKAAGLEVKEEKPPEKSQQQKEADFDEDIENIDFEAEVEAARKRKAEKAKEEEDAKKVAELERLAAEAEANRKKAEEEYLKKDKEKKEVTPPASPEKKKGQPTLTWKIDTKDEAGNSARTIIDRVEKEKQNATTLPWGEGKDAAMPVEVFESFLKDEGWTETMTGKRKDWVKGDRSLFLTSQGPDNSAIVQWKTLKKEAVTPPAQPAKVEGEWEEKYPWNMTLKEWLAYDVAGGEVNEATIEWHKEQVRQAIEDGEVVPANVLAEYPDLQKKEEKTPEQEAAEAKQKKLEAMSVQDLLRTLKVVNRERNELYRGDAMGELARRGDAVLTNLGWPTKPFAEYMEKGTGKITQLQTLPLIWDAKKGKVNPDEIWNLLENYKPVVTPKKVEAKPLFRSVSPAEMAHIIESGSVIGGLNKFNAFDQRREVFFGEEINKALIWQGEEIDRQATTLVLMTPEGSALWDKYEALNPELKKLREELNAEPDNLRKAPIRQKLKAVEAKQSVLQTDYTERIAVAKKELYEKAKSLPFTSYIIETKPVEGGKRYEGKESGMGELVDNIKHPEVGMPSGQIKLSDIVAVHTVKNGKVVGKTTIDAIKKIFSVQTPKAEVKAPEPAPKIEWLDKPAAEKPHRLTFELPSTKDGKPTTEKIAYEVNPDNNTVRFEEASLTIHLAPISRQDDVSKMVSLHEAFPSLEFKDANRNWKSMPVQDFTKMLDEKGIKYSFETLTPEQKTRLDNLNYTIDQAREYKRAHTGSQNFIVNGKKFSSVDIEDLIDERNIIKGTSDNNKRRGHGLETPPVYPEPVEKGKQYTAPKKEKDKKVDYGTPADPKTVPLSKFIKGYMEDNVDKGKILRGDILEAVAPLYGLTVDQITKENALDIKKIEEATEYAIIQRANEVMANEATTEEQKWTLIKALYNNQPTLSYRTSDSIIGQKYSTPLPLAYLISRYLDLANATRIYEPTAGNGMLLIGAKPETVIANELEKGPRLAALKDQKFGVVYNNNALEVRNKHSDIWMDPDWTIDRMVMNPPFGTGVKMVIDGTHLNKLEHQIAAYSLQNLAKDGKAAIIVGGHTMTDLHGKDRAKMLEADRVFIGYLYTNFNVTHFLEINGDVYKNMGTSYPIRMFIIEGKKETPKWPGLGAGDEQLNQLRAMGMKTALSFDQVRDNLFPKEEKKYGSTGVQKPVSGPVGLPGGEGGGISEVGGRPGEGVGAVGEPSGAGVQAGNEPGGRGPVSPVRSEGVGEGGRVPGVAEGIPGRVEGSESVERPGAVQPERNGLIEDISQGNQEDPDAHLDQLVAEDLKVSPSAAPKNAAEANQLLAKSVKEAGQATADAIKGIYELFGASAFKSFPGAIDENSYQKAKEYWTKSRDEWIQSGKDGAAWIRFWLDKITDAILPLFQRFVNELKARRALNRNLAGEGGVNQTAYVSRSQGNRGQNLVPINIQQEVTRALDAVEKKYGPVDDFVTKELGYATKDELFDAFSAEQIDALALAINSAKDNRGMIVGDQTGVGKGRIVAGMMVWAIRQGKKPVFVTADPKLFTDMWRDFIGINRVMLDKTSGKIFNPFIMHTDAAKASIFDEETGEKIYKPSGGSRVYTKMRSELDAWKDNPQGKVWDIKSLDHFDAIFTTYSQFQVRNSQQGIMLDLTSDNVVILDESHLAAGESERGSFFTNAIAPAATVVYSSATWAKRPDNTGLYYRTNIGDTGMDHGDLVAAIGSGGVPLQEWISNALAKVGQYLRRELNYKGIDFPTITDETRKDVEWKESDHVMERVRGVMDFDRSNEKRAMMQEFLKNYAHGGTSNVSRDNRWNVNSTNFASVVHNVIDEFLAGTKAEQAIEMSLQKLREGKKVIITLMHTMESFMDDHIEAEGLAVGSPMELNFSDVVRKSLRGCMRLTLKGPHGETVRIRLTPEMIAEYCPDTGQAFLDRYNSAMAHVNSLKTTVPGSFIDYVKSEIEKRAAKDPVIREKYGRIVVDEITGRKNFIDYSKDIPTLQARDPKEIKDKNGKIRGFQHGTTRVMVINGSASTGISLHAQLKLKDQSKRSMIIMQPHLDISTFMQTLGRINRKDQAVLPEYTLLKSNLPAESRPAVILQRKMNSLNANTSAKQESATTLKEKNENIPDMMNSYGDRVVTNLMRSNAELAHLLNIHPDPGEGVVSDAYKKATGKIAMLPAAMQKEFYEEIERDYANLIEHQNAMGTNKLVSRDYDLQARTLGYRELVQGSDEKDPFRSSAYLERVQVKVITKPYTRARIVEIVNGYLDGRPAEQVSRNLLSKVLTDTRAYIAKLQTEAAARATQMQVTLPTGGQAQAPAGIQARVQLITDQMQEIQRQLAGMYGQPGFVIGHTYDIPITDTVRMQAVLINIKYSEGTGSPVAPSKFQYYFALPHPMQSLMLPGSRTRDLAAARHVTSEPLRNWDSIAPQADTEIRHIMTGNLLRSYGQLNSQNQQGNALSRSRLRGEMISFTRDDGTRALGVMLQRDADVSGLTTGEASVDTVHTYLTNDALSDTERSLSSLDRKVELQPGIQYSQDARRSVPCYWLRVPGTQAEGAKYFTDHVLRDLVWDNNFRTWSRGRQMTATVSQENLRPLLDRLAFLNVKFMLPSQERTGRPGAGRAQFSTVKGERISSLDEAEMQKVADELGIKFQGFQEGRDRKPAYPTMFDPVTGGNFSPQPGQDIVAALNAVRKSFGVPGYAVTKEAKIEALSLESVRSIFKGQIVTRAKNGNIRVQTIGGATVEIRKVEKIDDRIRFNMAYTRELEKGEMIAGRYFEGVIDLVKGVADKWTIAHENVHFLEDMGILIKPEVDALAKHIRGLIDTGKFGKSEDNGGKEDRATFITEQLIMRSVKPDTLIGRIMEKIQKYIDRLAEAFGIRTPSMIVRSIDSGEIFSRAPQNGYVSPAQYEKMAEPFYSQLLDTVAYAKDLPKKASSVVNFLLKKNVKPAEMKWYDVENWIKQNQKDGVIDKAALLDYLKAQQITFKEKIRGLGEDQYREHQIPEQLENDMSDLDLMVEYDDISDFYQLVLNNEEGYKVINSLDDAPEGLQNHPVVADALQFIDSANQQRGREQADQAKFDNYVLPGGQKYRELLIQLPVDQNKEHEARSQRVKDLIERRNRFQEEFDNAKTNEGREDLRRMIGNTDRQIDMVMKESEPRNAYRGSHWEEPNVMGHVRFNERRDANGNRVLFIEEIQSDWHQAGKEKGYAAPADEAMNDALGSIGLGREQKVPRAPLSDNWHEFLMKRMIRWAAENGFERIAWTVGKTQADRYSLEKIIDSVTAIREGAYSYTIMAKKNGENVFRQGTDSDGLADLVGKEMARKIIAQKEKRVEYSGLDLRVGGEGMRVFYDQLLPAFMERYVKQWGAKVRLESVQTETEKWRGYEYEGPTYDTKGLLGIYQKAVHDDSWNADSIRQLSDVIKIMNENTVSVEGEITPHHATVFQYAMARRGSPLLASKLGGQIKPKMEAKHEPAYFVDVTPNMRSDAMRKGQPLFQVKSGPKTYEDLKRELEDAMALAAVEKEKPAEVQNKAVIEKGARVKKAADYLNGSGEYKKDFFSIARDTIRNWNKGLKEGKPDTSILARTFASPEFDFQKYPAAWRVFESGLSRMDKHDIYYNRLTGSAHGKGMLTENVQFEKERPEEYQKLSAMMVEADRNKTILTQIEDPKSKEMMPLKWNVAKTMGMSFEQYLDTARERFLNEGWSDQAFNSWKNYRRMGRNSLLSLTETYRQLVAEAEKNGLEVPKVIWTDENGEKIKVKLEVAESMMGDMTDFYYPRVRQQGEYVIIAKGPGMAPRYEMVDSIIGARRNIRMQQLRAEGYTDVTFEPTKGFGETVFDVAKRQSNLTAMMNAALEESSKLIKAQTLEDFGITMEEGTTKDGKPQIIIRAPYDERVNEILKGFGAQHYGEEKGTWHIVNYDPNIEQQLRDQLWEGYWHKMLFNAQVGFAHELATDLADIAKARGFRGHMIKRGMESGDQVWRGYEEDANKAWASYLGGTAAGLAKRDNAIEMVRAITGTDISWAEFKQDNPDAKYKEYQQFVKERRIDPGTQKNLYASVISYMQEMLRNQEFADRVVGTIKGLGVLKYLGFRVAAPAVNLTALMTSVPGTFHGYGKIPFTWAPKLIGNGYSTWREYENAKKKGDFGGMQKDDLWLMDQIYDKGWHNPQYNREAMEVLRSKLRGAYETTLEWSMKMFGFTETLNRVATIVGAYKGLQRLAERDGTQFMPDVALELAKKISDRAHGTYGKVAYPELAQGPTMFAHAARSFYMFSKFSHTYLQTMYDIGFKEKDKKALLYMAFAPTILAGTAGIPLMNVIWWTIKNLLGGLLDSDDPEEDFYNWMERNLGMGKLTRQGVPGVLGIDMRGSLQIKGFAPTTMKDLLGAPGSVFFDLYDAGHELSRGEYWRAVEKGMPRAIGTVFQAGREAEHGVTTINNTPVWFGGDQLRPSTWDTVVRSWSFNPADISEKKDILWSESKKNLKYEDMRKDIGAKIKGFAEAPPEKRTYERWAPIVEDIQDYNQRVIARKQVGIQPIIDGKWVRREMMQVVKPAKREIIKDIRRHEATGKPV